MIPVHMRNGLTEEELTGLSQILKSMHGQALLKWFMVEQQHYVDAWPHINSWEDYKEQHGGWVQLNRSLAMLLALAKSPRI